MAAAIEVVIVNEAGIVVIVALIAIGEEVLEEEGGARDLLMEEEGTAASAGMEEGGEAAVVMEIVTGTAEVGIEDFNRGLLPRLLSRGLRRSPGFPLQ